MAASPTPRPAGAERAFDAARAALGLLPDEAACPHPLAVAFSGGADSTALLRLACLLAPGRVQAFHIHHGLQAAADDFEQHCVDLCQAWGVPLRVLRVQARHAPGESPEDAARRARYAALAEAARSQMQAGQGGGTTGGAAHTSSNSGTTDAPGIRIWLGQHADDQVETLILALSRGAGLPGLSAMPARFEREGVVFERPLLSVPGSELRAWLQAEGITWVEDPTNQDVAFTRNRIRHQLLPALETAFPQFRETFARSSRHAAQAQALLAQLAQDDLAVARPPGQNGLRIEALQALSRERQANLLRHWLRMDHGTSPSAAQLEELLDQVGACRTRGHGIELRAGTGRIERNGLALVFIAGRSLD